MAKMKRKAKKGDSVKVHYTCKLSNGTIIDSSYDKEPIIFKVGSKEVIRGLDDAVIGMRAEESKVQKVSAEKAFGPYHNDWVLEVGRDQLPGEWKPEIGLRYEMPREDGKIFTATITRVSPSTVTLDFNHPMAGKVLLFEITLLEIQ